MATITFNPKSFGFTSAAKGKLQKKMDLHMHSTSSDGAHKPLELVNAASYLGLSVVALTDHDTISGIGPFFDQARKLNISAISGVEVTTKKRVFLNGSDFGLHKFHILSYGFNIEDSALASKFDYLNQHRRQQFIEMAEWTNQNCSQLSPKGLKRKPLAGETMITEEETLELIKKAGEGSVGRPLLAKMLTKNGWFYPYESGDKQTSPKDRIYNPAVSFLAIAKDHIPTKDFYYELDEIINFIHAAGGRIFLAHPLANSDSTLAAAKKVFNIRTRELGEKKDDTYSLALSLIAELAKNTDGIECSHSEHSSLDQKFLFALAKLWGKKISGGSDWHRLGEGRLMGIYPKGIRVESWLDEYIK